MGFVVLGIATYSELGIAGGVLQMFNHGTVTAMLFLIVVLFMTEPTNAA